MKRRIQFTVRTLLLLMIVSAIPCWWIASEKSHYETEKDVLAHMQEVNPRMRVVWENQTPQWVSSIGIQPEWMSRIIRVDATGVTCGNLKWEDYPKFQIEFDDKKLEQVSADLRKLHHLREVYFQVTKLSDQSLDFLVHCRICKSSTCRKLILQRKGHERCAIG